MLLNMVHEIKITLYFQNAKTQSHLSRLRLPLFFTLCSAKRLKSTAPKIIKKDKIPRVTDASIELENKQNVKHKSNATQLNCMPVQITFLYEQVDFSSSFSFRMKYSIIRIINIERIKMKMLDELRRKGSLSMRKFVINFSSPPPIIIPINKYL